MTKIPATYFDPDLATRNLIDLHQAINYDFIDISSAKILPQIFRTLNENFYSIKTKLCFNPDRCIELLSSIVDPVVEKTNLAISSLEFEKSIITNKDKVEIVSGLISNLKILKGFMSKDNRYVGIPVSINAEDKLKLLDIACNTCYDTAIGMVGYLTNMKKEHEEFLNQTNLAPDVMAIRKIFQQKKKELVSITRETSPKHINQTNKSQMR